MTEQEHDQPQHTTTTDDDSSESTPVPFLMPEESSEPHLSAAEMAMINAISKIAETEPSRAADLLAKIIGYRGQADGVVTPAGSRAYRLSHHSTPLLDAAIAKAQGAIRNAHINRRNDHLKSSYADLASVFEACRSACSEAGLAVTQALWPKKNFIMITTRLAHAGEWIECDFPVKAEAQKGVNAKQSVGIATTYGRRYALTSMLGIAAGEDTDGEDDRDEGGREGPEDIGKRWREAVDAFSKLGIKPPAMLAMVSRTTVAELTNGDMVKLRAKYDEIMAERG